MRSLGYIVTLLAAAAAAYMLLYPTTYYRFRMTVHVETPQGLKSGSSVLEARTRRYPEWTTLGNNTGETSLVGEAVFVDLGLDENNSHKNLIALLAHGERAKGIDFQFLPGKVFASVLSHSRETDLRDRAMELSKLPAGTKAELRGELIPTLVSFSNSNDPNSGVVLRPDSFDVAFGKGFRLREVSIEIISGGSWLREFSGSAGEPVTRRIEKKLPFLVSHREELWRLMDDMPPRFQPHFFLFTR